MSATALRRDIAGFIQASIHRAFHATSRCLRAALLSSLQKNPDLEIAETPMRDWVKWDSGCSVSQYASRMAVRHAAAVRKAHCVCAR